MQNDTMTAFFNMVTAINDDRNDHRHSFTGPMMAFSISALRKPPIREDGGSEDES
jgi:hypothetical protein